jgi:alpha-mannosidase
MMDEFYNKICGNNKGVVAMLGHTHIDVAWLWTLAQTKEKAQRSFSTAIRLMEQYPDYIFMSSQPQLYQYVKENDPVLYEKIKARIAEGRWEAEGAMWLEADTNIVSGESLVRQILLGKRFMREEFGKENVILWLPDVFGYSAALPQILKKSGVDHFFTAKLFWSETNKPVNDNFVWKGIDGSDVFVMLSPGYVNNASPQTVYNRWREHINKDYSDRQILEVGFGDGGGGTTPEMIESYERLKYGLPGFPKVEMRSGMDTVAKVKEQFFKNADGLRFTPEWRGER